MKYLSKMPSEPKQRGMWYTPTQRYEFHKIMYRKYLDDPSLHLDDLIAANACKSARSPRNRKQGGATIDISETFDTVDGKRKSPEKWMRPNDLEKSRSRSNDYEKLRSGSNAYDLVFHLDLGFDQTARRCDRTKEEIIRQRIYEQELARMIPLCSSHVHGHG